MRKVLAILLGLVYGYITYLQIMLLVEFVAYRRIDMEKVFYALYYPLGAPFLLMPSGWKYVRADEVLLNILGAVLLIAGVVYALRRSKESALKKQQL
jgi:hypothetical protein